MSRPPIWQWPDTPQYRYQHDPTFRTVVDLLESVIYWAELTPAEVRQAAMLAAIHYELLHTKPIRFLLKDDDADAERARPRLPWPRQPPSARAWVLTVVRGCHCPLTGRNAPLGIRWAGRIARPTRSG